MLKKLVALLAGEVQPEATDPGPFERRRIAVAALLLEAMYIDHRATDEEHAAVIRLLREHFHLPEQLAQALVAVAEERFAEVLDDWEFTEAVRLGFDRDERQEVLAMLWEVAYIDGDLARLEDRLMNRLAEQLDLSAELADAARAEAVARVDLLRDGARGGE